MKRIKSILVILLCCMLACLLQTAAFAAEAGSIDWDSLLPVPEDARTEPNPEERMAYNIYSDPDLSATSGRFDGFMIDFKADRAPAATYWALCNWQMNKDDLMSRYDAVEADAGAYAGLQMRPDGPKAIMAFWEINYTDATGQPGKIEARRVYPSDEDTSHFGGEGEGTNYICTYPWQAGQWYRMYLHCFRDETGRTFVEQWVADLSAGEWTLISRFDTGLYNSFFEGGMSQFMENYDYEYSNETRTFEYWNIRVREYGSEDWTEIDTSTLSVDTWWDNKKGNAVFGASEDRFFGITNGYGPGVYEMNTDVSGTYTIRTAGGPVETPAPESTPAPEAVPAPSAGTPPTTGDSGSPLLWGWMAFLSGAAGIGMLKTCKAQNNG